MRQVWITKAGRPEVLQVREAPDPSPGPGEVRIRVSAAGVNFADIMARLGLYPDAPPMPCVVGYEVSGVVDGVGAGVGGLADGQRVLALTRFGGYSDVVVVPQAQVATIADTTSFEAAAAVPVNYLTAWLMLVKLGNVVAGDTVLVHAVAGGVGQAALQICKWRGATVIGTASPGKHARLKAAGCDHCIDYTSQDFAAEVQRITAGRGVDIALDAVGGESFKKSYASLTDMGRLYVFGVSSMATGTKRSIVSAVKALLAMPSFKPIPLMNDNKSVGGVNMGHLWHRAEALGAMIAEIRDLVDDGTFQPDVDATFPFEEAAAAHAYIQARKNFGKVLLTA